MLSMSKLLSVISISAVTAFGATDSDVLNFFKNQISKNPQLELVSSNVIKKFDVAEPKGWQAVVVEIEFKVKDQNGSRKGNELIFVNGDYMSSNLINLKTGADLKYSATPPLDAKYYDKSRLVYGNEKAKTKIVIFSDPLCPFCMDYVPDAIEAVKKEPQKFALYFYHLPLEAIHPAATSLIKMVLA
ncbi:MAG: disulfide bond formation protein DsbA, partial [Campylobacterales bacterium]|nr:disulfide bond formation protein DsbA [Campylobacterales bacterium]